MNNGEAGDLKRHCANYDVTVKKIWTKLTTGSLDFMLKSLRKITLGYRKFTVDCKISISWAPFTTNMDLLDSSMDE